MSCHTWNMGGPVATGFETSCRCGNAALNLQIRPSGAHGSSCVLFLAEGAGVCLKLQSLGTRIDKPPVGRTAVESFRITADRILAFFYMHFCRAGFAGAEESEVVRRRNHHMGSTWQWCCKIGSVRADINRSQAIRVAQIDQCDAGKDILQGRRIDRHAKARINCDGH